MPKPTNKKAFQRAYKKLNREQKKAVDTLDGPVMVIAGPGTGKTQTIALRIANILEKTDTEPDAILALTFTESATKAMRERLASLIGQSAYYVTISTFHGFCVDVIRQNPDFFTIDPSAEPLSDLERLKLFHEIIDDGDFEIIRPVNAPHLYAKALMSSIQNLKREAINSDEFQKVLEQEQELLESQSQELTKTKLKKYKRDLAKNQELLKVYRAYQETITKMGRYDFEDMINFVTEAFENEKELLRDYQERFHHFLVDEYQDTNSAQNQVVDLLASFWKEKPNLFVVGDPSQSIFRFQGASVENTLSFLETYPTSTIITLKQNYRSQQTILDASHHLIQNNKLKIEDILNKPPTKLESAKDIKTRPIEIAELSSSDAEKLFIAEKIQELIKSGTKPSEIAVIYKRNSSAPEIASVLTKFNIDYAVQGGGNVLEDPTVKRLIKILRVIRDLRYKKDDLNLFTILHYDIFSIDPLDVLKLSRAASSRRLTLFDILENNKLISELDLNSQEELEKALAQLTKWQKIDANSTFIDFFEKVLNQSGYLNWLLEKNDSYHKISAINTLFSEIKRMNFANHDLDLETFLQNIDLMEKENLKISLPEFAPREDAVVLTTAHSAKGLEWKYVFLYKVVDRLWGNQGVRQLIRLPEEILPHTDTSKKEKNEDERRVFYVAITRAKKQVIITYANTYTQRGRTKEKLPSMFIEEIPESLKNQTDTKKTEQEISTHLEKILQTNPETKPISSKKETEFLKKTLSRFRLSPTALNTYLECPYKFKLNNLLRVPKAKKPYLAFGTAVHKALETFHQQLNKERKTPSKKYLLSSYEKAIKNEILTKEELTERTQQGKSILSAYYDFYKYKFQKSIWSEKFFSPHLGEIPLSGKVDRIEWDEKSKKTIRVVDYKTGKPKTKGQIEGTTKYSKGNLKRQLVFYKLLVDLDRRLKVDFGQAELDFVEEPKRKQKSGKKRFNITPDETNQLKKTIKNTMNEIQNFNFQRTTDYSNCTNCEFKDHCWPEGIPNQSSKNEKS